MTVTDRSAAPRPRPLVLDPVYATGTEAAALRGMLESVDAATVPVAGGRRFTRDVLRDALGAAIAAATSGADDTRPVVIGYPSTWGAVRRAVLAAAVADLPVDVSLVPRAVLIARSHSDVAMQRCAVVETTHVPGYPVDPAHPLPRSWDVQRLTRGADGWVIDRSGVIGPDGPADRVEALIDDSVEAVFVDGEVPAEVSDAIDLVRAHVVAGRVVGVDHPLIARYGARSGLIEPMTHVVNPAGGADSSSRPSTRRRWVWAAAAVALVVAVGAAVVGVWQRDEQPPDPTRQLSVGRTSLIVPTDWQQSSPPPPSGSAGTADTVSRTVFTDPATGGRILLVQTEVRSGSTTESVATSLANRIRQRGDDVVTEFSASTRFAGRDVIAYREAPASGSAIRWYVLVAGDLQVSIGCQAGSDGQPVDAQCATAVGSARVADA